MMVKDMKRYECEFGLVYTRVYERTHHTEMRSLG